MCLPQSRLKNAGHGSEKYSDSKVTEVALESFAICTDCQSTVYLSCQYAKWEASIFIYFEGGCKRLKTVWYESMSHWSSLLIGDTNTELLRIS